eukprot:UN19785
MKRISFKINYVRFSCSRISNPQGNKRRILRLSSLRNDQSSRKTNSRRFFKDSSF